MAVLNENYIVEKSRALVWAKMTDYGPGELRILDTYLSRIDARNPETSRVVFTKTEFEQLLGLEARIRTSKLKESTKKLLTNVVTLELPDGRKGYAQYPLFSEAECEFDPELGQTVIRIDCNPKLQQAFFDLAQSKYITYQLKNTLNMKGKYSIRLYSLLMDRLRIGWKVPVDELRDRLAANTQAYMDFKRFNDHVIKKSVAEINEKTNLNVEVEYIKKGKFVGAVQFRMKLKEQMPTGIDPKEEDDEEDLNVIHMEEAGGIFIPSRNDPLSMYEEELPKEFTREQIAVLAKLTKQMIPDDITSEPDQEIYASEYIQEKVELMNTSKTPIRNKFDFLYAAIKYDYKKGR